MSQKWIEVNDIASGQYSVNNDVRFKNSMLRSGLCDYRDVYIVVKGFKEIMMIKLETKIFKNNDLFRSCISKINNTFIDNAQDLRILMLMYKFLEYSCNYSMTLGSLWNYYKDQVNEDESGNNNTNNNDE